MNTIYFFIRRDLKENAPGRPELSEKDRLPQSVEVGCQPASLRMTELQGNIRDTCFIAKSELKEREKST